MLIYFLIVAGGNLFIPIATILGMLHISVFIRFTATAIVFGIFTSIAAVFPEECSFRRYAPPTDLPRLLLHAFFENLGYR
jgi:hypothetical protein